MQLNKVFIAGHITREVDIRYTSAGLAVTSFGLAVNRKWKDKSGEAKEDVCFVDINAFGRTAEVMGEYLKKGSPVFIEGRLHFSQWEKDGQKRSALRVVAENFQFLSSGDKKPRGGDTPAGVPPSVAGDGVVDGEAYEPDIGENEIPF